jgi:hypothetical protein
MAKSILLADNNPALRQIDRAAKRRGLNRISWLRYAATRELDREEQ